MVSKTIGWGFESLLPCQASHLSPMKNPFSTIRIFVNETLTELKKATWPTLMELRDSTIVVLVSIAIVGLFIAVADFSLANVVNLFTGWMR